MVTLIGLQKNAPMTISAAFGFAVGSLIFLVCAGCSTTSPEYGYIDRTGCFKISPRYITGKSFSGGRAVVILSDGTSAMVDHSGNVVAQFGEEAVESLSDGLAAVSSTREDGITWRYVDSNGTTAISGEFPYGEPFSEGLAVVKLPVNEFRGCWKMEWGPREEFDYLYGYIDKQGVQVVPNRYAWASAFSEGLGLVLAYSNGIVRIQHLSTNGTTVVDLPSRSQSGVFTEGLACVRLLPQDGEEGYGFVDRSGHWAIEPKYIYAESFSEGLAQVAEMWTSSDGTRDRFVKHFVDSTGTIVISDVTYEIPRSTGFSGGLLPVFKRHNREPRESHALEWGYIDRSGRLRIPLMYEDAESFSEGLAAVKLGGKWGFIDTKGVFVIHPRFRSAESFSEGLSLVEPRNDRANREQTHSPLILSPAPSFLAFLP